MVIIETNINVNSIIHLFIGLANVGNIDTLVNNIIKSIELLMAIYNWSRKWTYKSDCNCIGLNEKILPTKLTYYVYYSNIIDAIVYTGNSDSINEKVKLLPKFIHMLNGKHIGPIVLVIIYKDNNKYPKRHGHLWFIKTRYDDIGTAFVYKNGCIC